MSQPFLGEIRLVPYTFAPRGWAFCHGQLLSISQNDALFSLVGTIYGGDGTSTFGLPDLRGRIAIHRGTGQGLSGYVLGDVGGQEGVSLQAAQMPAHSHGLGVATAIGDQTNPVGNAPATSPLALGFAYAGTANGTMPAGAVENAGGGQPHGNMQPYLALNYVIALTGIYPTRN